MVASPAKRTQAPPPLTIVDYWPPHADVLFDFDRTTIKPGGRERLDYLVSQMPFWRLEAVVVTGYAAHLGASTYNDALSLRRALTVKAYLVSKGIPEAKIYAEGKGANNRVTAACNERVRVKAAACLAPDRRVEVEVSGTPTQ